MINPHTPSKKGEDEVSRILKDLSDRWGLYFPPRDQTWSPSLARPDSVEDRIRFRIKFLYFKDKNALNHVLHDFDKHANELCSKWQYKPKGQRDVIPSRPPPESAVRRDAFLKRDSHRAEALEEMMQCLDHLTRDVVDRVKNKELFPVLSSLSVTRQPSIDEARSPKPTPKPKKLRQSTLNLGGSRSSSEPIPKTDTSSQHPFSDDINDEDFNELALDVEMQDAPPMIPSAPNYRVEKTSESVSPGEERFETPPTSPSKATQKTSGLGILDGTDHTSVFRKPDPMLGRKRPRAEHVEAQPRKISRDRAINAISGIQNPQYPLAYMSTLPTPPLETKTPFFGSFGKQKSFDNLPSTSTSFSSTSSAWTSPNTSFSTMSVASSINFSAEETDSTIRTAVDMTRRNNLQSKPLRPTPVLPDAQALSHSRIPHMEALSESNGAQPSNIATVEHFHTRLISESPFVSLDSFDSKLPYKQLWEVYRVSINCHLPVNYLQHCLNNDVENYDSLWTSLTFVVKSHGRAMPERSSVTAWNRFGQKGQNVACSGGLRFSQQPKGPVFELFLNPLRLEPSYRLGRKFGHDRFCIFSIPGLGVESLPSIFKAEAAGVRSAFVRWLVETQHRFLGRTWRAFYTKPDTPNKRQKKGRVNGEEFKHRIYFFAVDGHDFMSEERRGELDPRKPYYCVTVDQLVEWFMPHKNNTGQASLKFFSRLQLGLSNNVQTVEFRPYEIIRSDDAYADSPQARRLNYHRSDEKKNGVRPSKSKSPVMNDGCARISRHAATAVSDSLGLDRVPCVFQGRIGGAKGMWMVDALDEGRSRTGRNFWIEITDSQLKFNGHGGDHFTPDAARVAFEVNKYSKKLIPSFLNFQLLPILEDRGVKQEVFVKLLQEDLTAKVGALEVAMDSGLGIWKWNQENNPVGNEREQYGGIEFLGGLPSSSSETINWFVEHGFEPKHCRYLKDVLFKAIKAYCLRLENRMNIGLGQSTNAYMIADPLDVLAEGEVHIHFSGVFQDPKSGFDSTMLDEMDVLVARFPAHVPSDIQKVRAVFKKELQIYRDVVVFSSRGEKSLASKLSGGDYDGDKAWICWDVDIVQPFQNADTPKFPPPEYYGIETDQTKVSDFEGERYMTEFLHHGLDFNLNPSMLGICTNYHESYCYLKKSINTPQAIDIAGLLGNLVDSAKGGFRFDEAKWIAYLKKYKLPFPLAKPAYKNKDKAPATKNTIDVLVFETAKNVRQQALGHFDRHFKDVSHRDDDLVRIRNEEFEEGKSNPHLCKVLKYLESEIESISRFWKMNVRQDEDDDLRPSRQGDRLSFRSIIDKCRADFLAIPPKTDTEIETPISDIVKRWQREHKEGRTGHWELVKASVAFFHHSRTNFIWHMAGRELGEIKAMAKGRTSYQTVTNNVHEFFKIDSKLVDKARRRSSEGENGLACNDDEDDEFGEWGWEDQV